MSIMNNAGTHLKEAGFGFFPKMAQAAGKGIMNTIGGITGSTLKGIGKLLGNIPFILGR